MFMAKELAGGVARVCFPVSPSVFRGIYPTSYEQRKPESSLPSCLAVSCCPSWASPGAESWRDVLSLSRWVLVLLVLVLL